MNGDLPPGRSPAPRKKIDHRRRRRHVRRRSGDPLKSARGRLRRFRQATLLAVAVTGFLLLIFTPGEIGFIVAAGQNGAASPAPDVSPISPTLSEALDEPLGQAAVEEAARTIETLWRGFYGNLPKFIVVIAVFLIAWASVRVLRPLMRRTLHRWERANAAVALSGIVVWLLAVGIALSVLAGDIRALVGSLGLIGLALSWALQTPIESFTGWLLNSFQGYYRVGDRVAVGEVFGDVYQIDFLTTTVWEIGSPARGGFVQAEQPTGRMITFPNNEVLAGSVVNLTRDFPFVWDELEVPLANESDLGYGMRLLAGVARDLLGDRMAEPARRYGEILREAGLETSVPEEPQVFISMSESWTDLTIRYLVHARERRRWKSELTLLVMEELKKPEHAGRLIGVYPRRQVQFVGSDGLPRDEAGNS